MLPKSILILQNRKLSFLSKIASFFRGGSKPAEMVSKGPIPQSPNMPTTWSQSQQSKDVALRGPRFEQMNLEYQPNPLSAQELIAKIPISKVEKRIISCDGGQFNVISNFTGGGALGHPKVYINLDKPGAAACGYCGLRFEQIHH